MPVRNALLFLAATTVLSFANGRWSFALAAWLAPALLLAFMRDAKRPFLAGWIATSVACYFWWSGIFPLRGVAYAAAAIVFGLIALLPYLADRAIARRIPGLLGTLVFPSAVVMLETLTMLFSPFGSWGSFAYTQYRVLPLVQLVSITGLAGLTFLIAWFASIANLRTRPGFVVYACVLAAVLTFGFVRLQSPEARETVRIAAITPRIPTYTVRGDAVNAPIYAVLQSVRRQQPLTESAWAAFRMRASAVERELLSASEAELRRGAKIIVWSEGAAIVERGEEAGLVKRAAELARRARAAIAVSFLTVDARGSSTFENKTVLVDARGSTVWTYHKAHPVPGMEACIPGDGRLPVVQTPYGRLATAICFDMDFPRLIRQARADIMLVPSDDWREIAPRHSQMAAFRAVEQGFALVRPASNGLSLAVDRFGRVQASQDYFSGARVMHARVPRQGARTVYSRIGDVVPACAALVLVVLSVAPRMGRGAKRLPRDAGEALA